MHGRILVIERAEFIYGLTRVSECSGIESILDWMDNWPFLVLSSFIERVQKEILSFRQTPSQEQNRLSPDSFTETIRRQIRSNGNQRYGIDSDLSFYAFYLSRSTKKKEEALIFYSIPTCSISKIPLRCHYQFYLLVVFNLSRFEIIQEVIRNGFIGLVHQQP